MRNEQGSVEDKRKRRHFLMTSLQWFSFLPFTMFTNKANIFLDDGLYRKIWTRVQGLLSQ